ncbi:MAG: ABC transporter substrate-binding protein [Candidatus Firestonebacteria bacterium]|nr:ABC transporter substrate-binding protein [Candidatus Firestonebacteria bacterium]
MIKTIIIFAISILLPVCAAGAPVDGGEKTAELIGLSKETDGLELQKPEEKNQLLKIGVLLPCFEESDDYSQKVKRGTELALRAYNLKRKTTVTAEYSAAETDEVKLEEFYKTSAADPRLAGIIGPLKSSSMKKVRSLAEKYRLVTVAPFAAVSESDPGSEYFFSSAILPQDEGRSMAEFTVKTLKKKKVGVLYPANNAYGAACALAYKEELVKLGGEVTKEEKYEEGSYDFKEQMLSLGGVAPHLTKEIMAEDKNNLEGLVLRLVNQLRALLPLGTEKKKTEIVLVKLENAGRAGQKLSDARDYGQIISEKLSYGLGKNKDTRLPKLAEVQKYIKRSGFNKEQLARHFGANIIISGSVFEKNPLSYTAKLLVEDLEKNSTVEVLFDFSVTDNIVTNPGGLEAVYIPAGLLEAESIISHLLFFELKVPYLGNTKLNDRKFIAGIKQTDSKLYFTADFYPESAIPEVDEFVRAYKKAYFEEPEYSAAAAFDAVNIILHTLGRGAANKEEVRNSIRNISYIDLITGAAAYAEGRFKKNLRILGLYERELREVK